MMSIIKQIPEGHWNFCIVYGKHDLKKTLSRAHEVLK